MDYQLAHQVGLALLPHLPTGTPVREVAHAATRAWTAHHLSARMRRPAMKAVVDTTWELGYQTGVVAGRRIVTDLFQKQAMDELSELTRQGINDRAARRLLWTVATASTRLPGRDELTGPGPNERDYLTAYDADTTTTAGWIAAAARVGWTHAEHAGRTDAARSTAGAYTAAAAGKIGDAAVRATWIAEMPGNEWLTSIEHAAREKTEQGIGPPGRGVLRTRSAFTPLTTIRPTATTNAGPACTGATAVPAHGRRGR